MLLSGGYRKHDMRAVCTYVRIVDSISKGMPSVSQSINPSISICGREKQTWNYFDNRNLESGLFCSRPLLCMERILLCSKGRRHAQITLVNATGRCGRGQGE